MAGVEGEHYLECVMMTMQWEVLVEKVWRGWMARKWYECSGVVVCQHRVTPSIQGMTGSAPFVLQDLSYLGVHDFTLAHVSV